MQIDFNSKQWGVADFERYYSGKMPEAERHALEKAALDDPFLQDALDGYEFAATPVNDIAFLKEKLWPATDNAPVFAIPWYKTKLASQLFKAAAIVILFGGLGWLYINRSNNVPEKSTELATNEKAAKTEVVTDSNQALLNHLNDSAPIIAKLDKELPITPANTSPTNNMATKDFIDKGHQAAAVEAEELARNEIRSKEKSAYTPLIDNDKKTDDSKKIANITVAPSQKRNNQISGKIINQQGEPVPHAVVKNNADSRQTVSSDVNGNFVMNNANTPTNSNAVPVEVNATGYEQSNQNIANNSTNNTIVLSDSENKLNEVVVSSAKTKKEKYQWNGRNSRIQLRNAKPLEGWDYFYYVMNDSISNNKLLMQQKGRMILSFNVDDSGKVEQVAVKKSLNPVADSIAAKILIKSPVLEVINRQKKGEAIIKMY